VSSAPGVDEAFRRRLRLIMQQFASVADLARAIGVSDNAIYKWVSGRGQPGVASVVQLARAANVSVEWLATGSDAASTPLAGFQRLRVHVIADDARARLAYDHPQQSDR